MEPDVEDPSIPFLEKKSGKLSISKRCNGTEKTGTATTVSYSYELSTVGALLVPLVLTIGHMLVFYSLWGGTKHKFDRASCTCSCWDTVFKGPYESGIAHYKHVYFNSTWNTTKMWILTVVALISVYESFRRVFELFLTRKLRVRMGILFLSSLHSNYYAFWGTWNYWNDEFYNQWWHQMFFTVTELVTTICVWTHLDRRKPLSPLPLLLVGTIALFHILTSSWDQFVSNVFLGQGLLHQVLRDVLIMSTDILYVILTLQELRSYAIAKGETLRSTLLQKKHVLAVIALTVLLFVFFVILVQ